MESQIDTTQAPGGAGQPTRAELERLAALFEGQVPLRPRKQKPLPPLKLVQRSVLGHMDMRRICYFRFGTERPVADS